MVQVSEGAVMKKDPDNLVKGLLDYIARPCFKQSKAKQNRNRKGSCPVFTLCLTQYIAELANTLQGIGFTVLAVPLALL